MDLRFNEFLKEILNNCDKSILVIQGIMLLSFLQNNCEFEYKDRKIFARYNDKVIIDECPKSPGVYKITYDENNNIVDISDIY